MSSTGYFRNITLGRLPDMLTCDGPLHSIHTSLLGSVVFAQCQPTRNPSSRKCDRISRPGTPRSARFHHDLFVLVLRQNGRQSVAKAGYIIVPSPRAHLSWMGKRWSSFTTSPGPTRRASTTSHAPIRSKTVELPLTGKDVENGSVARGALSGSNASGTYSLRVRIASQSSSNDRRRRGGCVELL